MRTVYISISVCKKIVYLYYFVETVVPNLVVFFLYFKVVVVVLAKFDQINPKTES